VWPVIWAASTPLSGKALAEEAEELFKSAERREKITGLEREIPNFKEGRRHEGFLF
jgi:hypothetical protein